MSTTTVDFTTEIDINKTIPLHFQCPENTTIRGIQGVLGNYNEYSQTFTHCLVYSSTCPSIGMTFIPAGSIKKINVCIQLYSFQTMLAMGDKVPCSFASPKVASILPIWKIPESDPMSIIELNTVMKSGGDSYLVNQVKTETGTKIIIQSTDTGAPDLQPAAKKINISSILSMTCSNADIISNSIATQYLALTSSLSGTSLADNYNFFSINYKQTTLSQLQANPLGVFGSVSGAWGGIVAIFGIIYTVVLTFSQPKDTPASSTDDGKVHPSELQESSQIKKSNVVDEELYEIELSKKMGKK